MQANRLGRDYLFYNLLEIVRDEFPVQFTTEIRMLCNRVLMESDKDPIETDAAFIKELYG